MVTGSTIDDQAVLDDTEREVLSLLARGMDQRDAADWLGISTQALQREAAAGLAKLFRHGPVLAATRGLLIPDDTEIPRRGHRRMGKRGERVTAATWQEILDLMEAGASLKEACAKVNISPATVSHRARKDAAFRAQLKARGWPGQPGSPPAPFNTDALIAALAEGAGIGEACRRAGISYYKYHQRLDRDAEFRARVAAVYPLAYRVGRKNERVTAATWQEILDLMEAGASLKEACAKVNVDPSTANKRARKDAAFRAQLKARGWPRPSGRPPAPIDEDTLIAALSEGAGIGEACRRAGISYYKYHQRLDRDAEFRARVDSASAQGKGHRRARRPRPDWLAPLLDELLRGSPLSAACTKLQLVRSTVYKHRRRPEIDEAIRAAMKAGQAHRADTGEHRPAGRSQMDT